MNAPAYVRSNHWAAFHRGEWARIVTTTEMYGRACWCIKFDDGATDVWVIDDPDAGYEFA